MLIAQIGDALAVSRCTKLPTKMTLADEWLRFFMVAPPSNAASLEDCRAAVEMRFQTLYGESTAGWSIQADWTARHPFLTCALPIAVADGLRRLARDHQLALIEIKPHFIAAWNRWHRQMRGDTWFGVATSKSLTLSIVNHRRLSAIRTVAIPDGAWTNPRWLPEQLAREALRLNVPTPSQVHLCGNIPDDWDSHDSDRVACHRLDASLAASQLSPMSDAMMLALAGM